MQNLRKIVISDDKQTARMQAGVYSNELNHVLFDQGYITSESFLTVESSSSLYRIDDEADMFIVRVATGSGSCVGIAGPGLGGGHGPYQGHHGMISDNFVSMDVVLANGSSVFVSATSNPDLWWAMRGAGHNFGILTSFEMKIYPTDVTSWYYRSYVFGPDKMETIFEEVNELHQNGTMKPEMAAAMVIGGMQPSVSSTEVSLLHCLRRNGYALYPVAFALS